jgi:hypothetical protein
VNLRQTHPNLYKAYFIYGIVSIAIGLNFIFLNPTFMQLDLPKLGVGTVFLIVGLAQLFFLIIYQRATLLRLAMSAIVTVIFFWSFALIFDFFRLEQTSLQLPIVFLGFAVLGLPLMIEPSSNPLTDKNGVNGKNGNKV